MQFPSFFCIFSLFLYAATPGSCALRGEILTTHHIRQSDEGPNAAAKRLGKIWFGSCYDSNYERDQSMMKYFNDPKFIGQLTPENSMKPASIQRTKSQYDFKGGDAVVAQAKKLGAKIRCHFLMGPDQNAPFIQQGSGINRQATLEYLDGYMKTVMTHFGTNCYSWDVVNEALTESGQVRTDVPWYRLIGHDFVEQAFAIASKHRPSGVKLCYNDFRLEASAAKLQGALDMANRIKSVGGEIDCISFESHISASNHPTVDSFTASLNRVAEAGMEVPISELDVVREGGATEAQQAAAYALAVKACLRVEKCPGVTVWGLSDSFGWLKGKQADLFDTAGRPKTAFTSLMGVLSSSSKSDVSSEEAEPQSQPRGSTVKIFSRSPHSVRRHEWYRPRSHFV